MFRNSKFEIRISRVRGQALLELAVFSTIFLMILTAIVAYGLRYSYNQRAQMLTFRRAMKIASDRNYGSGTYMLIQDRHIPDPGDPFGIGSTQPFMASASVIRDPEMDAQADDAASLPAMVIDMETTGVNGNMEPMARMVVRNAAFRRELIATEPVIDFWGFSIGAETDKNMLEKYQMIYGGVVDLHEHGSEPAGTIRIMDSCAGEALDFSSCYAQAVKIVDTDACARDCQVSSAAGTDCFSICSRVMNPPNQNDPGYDPVRGGAWYAANWRLENGQYVFPVLNEIFDRIGENAKSMGMQPGATTRAQRSSSIRKVETTARIVTDERASWGDHTVRQFATFNNMQPDGYQVNHDNPMDYADRVEVSDINSRSTGNIRQTFSTPK